MWQKEQALYNQKEQHFISSRFMLPIVGSSTFHWNVILNFVRYQIWKGEIYFDLGLLLVHMDKI